jgi:hypothetical protein
LKWNQIKTPITNREFVNSKYNNVAEQMEITDNHNKNKECYVKIAKKKAYEEIIKNYKCSGL